MKWKKYLPKKKDNCIPDQSCADAVYEEQIVNLRYNQAIDDCVKSLEGKILSVDDVELEELAITCFKVMNPCREWKYGFQSQYLKLATAIKSLLERKARE